MLAPGPALAGAFEDALAASDRGDLASALQGFRTAAAAGDVRAYFNLGRIYRNGQGTPVDYAQALSWTRKAADRGLPGAQFDLGLMYQKGLGVHRNGALAVAWFQRAATQGYSSAELNLGDLYAEGRAARRDLAQAEIWYRRAAVQGDVEAQYKLGLLDIRIDRVRAGPSSVTRFAAIMDAVFGPRRWRQTGGYRTNAQENMLRARGALTVPVGMTSRHSIGTPAAPGAYDAVVDGMTTAQAAARLHRAGAPFRTVYAEAAHGDQGPHLHLEPYPFGQEPRDRIRLASLGSGDQVAAESDDAVTWLRKAGDQGHAAAQLRLGEVFARERGKQANLVAAYSWTSRAAANPTATPSIRREAAQALTALRRRMKPDQIAWAQAPSLARPTPAAAAGEVANGASQP